MAGAKGKSICLGEAATARELGRARRGATYLFVLCVSVIVMLIGLSAIAVSRVAARGSRDAARDQRAGTYAASAVDWALLCMRRNGSWRDDWQGKAVAQTSSFGGGTLAFGVTDELDADLENRAMDLVRVTGTGQYDGAKRLHSVLAQKGGTPLECLETGLLGGNDVLIQSGAQVAGNCTVAANGTVDADNAVVYPDVEAANSVTGYTYYGSTDSWVPQRSVPDGTVFDFYLAAGTPIAYGALEGGRIKEALLTPKVNPYGATNPYGIYVVDGAGNKVIVERSRIVGTLMLINAASDSTVHDSSLSPALANYPSLLVNGSLKLDGNKTLFTLSRDYEHKTEGLVYVSNDLLIKDYQVIEGCVVVGNTCTVDGSAELTLSYDPVHRDVPPPGFWTGMGEMRTIPQSGRWEVQP